MCNFPSAGSTTATRDGSLLAKQPLSFQENQGQWPSSICFVATKGNISAVVEATGIRFYEGRQELFGIRFEGVKHSAAIMGEALRPTRYNYYFGNDPAAWRSNVPSFQSVIYRGLYDGIDLRLREDSNRLEYDVLVNPGADLRDVVFRID